MIREAIDRILSLGAIHQVEIHGDQYTKESLHIVKRNVDHNPEKLTIHTLDGFLDYISGMFAYDNHESDAGPAIHIVDHKRLDLIGPMQHGNQNSRFTYAQAVLIADVFNFGVYHDLEEFVIELQAKFVHDDTVDAILTMLGSLASEHVKENKDDGFSQSIEVKMGLRVKSEVKVENPVKLFPWRTFREVDQPGSNFILRLKEGSDGIKVALYEADGAQWKIDAIENIMKYLQGKMSTWSTDKQACGIIS